jgi:hypothetical protein
MGCEDCISISREFLVIDICWENRGVPFVYTGTLGGSLKLLGHLGLPISASLGEQRIHQEICTVYRPNTGLVSLHQ